jgi:asparagine synthase (glutamine-hydrolysing)
MCGIAGVISWNRSSPALAVVDDMLGQMVHRGPDYQGHRTIEGADLGSCRLAIQDLSPAGHQPLFNETRSVAVVFNGEIYNAPALRTELVERGHRFQGHSDTEVLVHGYEEWGIEGLHERCDGMWAFVLWDAVQRTAYLSRDRVGEKPLFYSRRNGELWFASTIASLLAPWRTIPNHRPDVVLEYLACGYVPPDRCAFEGIDKLPPATYLVMTGDGARLRRYWRLDYEEHEEDPQVLERRLEELLDRAVGQCLLADVPLGAYLSGGVDSSLVVAMMARHHRRPRTFTMRVPGTERDEGQYARAVSRRYDTDHVEIPLGSDCVEALPDLAYLFGEPFADSSSIPAYFVAREIRKHVTVVLGGDGGDEGFGGYRGVPYLTWLERFHRSGAWYLRSSAPRLLEWADGRRGRVARAVRAGAYASDFDVYLRNLCVLGPAQANALAGPALQEARFEHWCRPFAAALAGFTARRWHQRGLAVGLHATLTGDYLVKIDTTAMAHSVETRSPFLTRAVLEFAARLPAHAIANRTEDKVLLKRLARRLVPRECVDRRKSGFSVPLERWLDGPWRQLTRELLGDSLATREGLLSRDGLNQLMRRDPIFEYRWDVNLFSVLMLELWLRLVAKRTDTLGAIRNLIVHSVKESPSQGLVA